MDRFVGTLLPITALPKFDEIGLDAGYEFIDWIKKSGQNGWQILPVHQTAWDEGRWNDSPYSGYGIGLNPNLLGKDRSGEIEVNEADYEWIEDYCLFGAMSNKFETDYWPNWPQEAGEADSGLVGKLRLELRAEIEMIKNQQLILISRFKRLREYAASKKVVLMGDVPFYVPINSPLVWRYKEAFEIDQNGQTEYVSGAMGGKHFGRQAWGHPLYKWNENSWDPKIENIWNTRLKFAGELFDVVRLDSGIRFYTFGRINTQDEALDEVAHGPGGQLFVPVVKAALERGTEIFVEDVADFDLVQLQVDCETLGIPGMSVLTMVLTSGELNLRQRYFRTDLVNTNHIFYTSTHDVEPLVTFCKKLTVKQREVLTEFLDLETNLEDEALAGVIREYTINNCRRVIVPMEDWLGGEERINTPGTVGEHNWSYKLKLDIADLPTVIF